MIVSPEVSVLVADSVEDRPTSGCNSSAATEYLRARSHASSTIYPPALIIPSLSFLTASLKKSLYPFAFTWYLSSYEYQLSWKGTCGTSGTSTAARVLNNFELLWITLAFAAAARAEDLFSAFALLLAITFAALLSLVSSLSMISLLSFSRSSRSSSSSWRSWDARSSRSLLSASSCSRSSRA